MKLRWQFRCYPTTEQKQHLDKVFGCTRFVYNWGLDLRTTAFKGGERINFSQTCSELTKLKQDPECVWLNEVSSVTLQQSLRHLQSAFSSFFEKRTAYPSFKKKGYSQSASFVGTAFKFNLVNRNLSFAKIGRVKVKWSRRVPVQPTTVTIIKKPSGRYFISMVIDINPAPTPKTGESVGIDFGISRLATLSNGERIPNPRYLSKCQTKLAKAQKDLARKQKGSNRHEKARVRVARIHEKIADSRKDNLNKLAWDLVNRFDQIYVEDLDIRGMVKNHNLSRSLSDAAIGTAIRQLEAKAVMHDKQVVKIDRFFPSSKMCSVCGHVLENLPLSVRNWTCEKCKISHDRDLNAARNILAVGQTVSAHGDGVRATRSSDRPASC